MLVEIGTPVNNTALQVKSCIQKLTAEDGPSVKSTIATAACQESW